MPPVKFAPAALRDLERLREFLRPKNPVAAKRAALSIIKAVQVLGQHPQIGRPAEEMDVEYRELLVDFGDSGYIALYRQDGDCVIILSVRHQKEAGF
jgi:plasmid stabilization system protein ParE